MDIAVVGSFQPARKEGQAQSAGTTASSSASSKKQGRVTGQERGWEVFEKACKAIGRALGEGGHRLMVAHRGDPTGKSPKSAEALALDGFMETKGRNHYVEIPYHIGDPQLKGHTEAVERSDAVILIGGKEGTYAAGLSALLRRKMMIPVPAFGGSARDLCAIAEINRTVIDELRNLDTTKPGWTEILTSAITTEINSYPGILIVHGRGDDGTTLRDKIRRAGAQAGPLKGIGEPLIMDLSGRGALSVPEVFEKFASRVSATIAIVTADDVGGFARRDGRGEEEKSVGSRSTDQTDDPKDSRGTSEPDMDQTLPATELRLGPRARENVWVEVGWFWGRLGRRRIFLWLKDDVPLPSDLQGAAWSKGDLLSAWSGIQDFIINLREGENELRTNQQPLSSPENQRHGRKHSRKVG